MEILAAYTALNKILIPNKKEQFENVSDNDTKEKKSNSIIAWVLLGIFVIPMLIIGVITYIRTVVIAFGCSTIEGIISIFFSTLWSFWKLGTLIKVYCSNVNQQQM